MICEEIKYKTHHIYKCELSFFINWKSLTLPVVNFIITNYIHSYGNVNFYLK